MVAHVNEIDGYVCRNIDNVQLFTSWSDKPSLWHTFPAISVRDESSRIMCFGSHLHSQQVTWFHDSLAINSISWHLLKSGTCQDGNFKQSHYKICNKKTTVTYQRSTNGGATLTMATASAQVCPNTAGPKRTAPTPGPCLAEGATCWCGMSLQIGIFLNVVYIYIIIIW